MIGTDQVDIDRRLEERQHPVMVDPIQLTELFRRQVLACLDQSDRALGLLEASGADHDALEDLSHAAEMLCDLAMVYGYEDIEALAGEIHANARKALRGNKPVSSRWRQNILEAVSVLRRMMDEQDQPAGRQPAEEQPLTFVLDDSESARQPSGDEVELFDIVEDEGLLRLLSETKARGSAEPLVPGQEAEPGASEEVPHEEQPQALPEVPLEEPATEDQQRSDEIPGESYEEEPAGLEESGAGAYEDSAAAADPADTSTWGPEIAREFDLFAQVFAEELEVRIQSLREMLEELVRDPQEDSTWQRVHDILRAVRDNAFKLDLRPIHAFSAEFLQVVDEICRKKTAQTHAAVEAVRLGIEFLHSYRVRDRDLERKREYVMREFEAVRQSWSDMAGGNGSVNGRGEKKPIGSHSQGHGLIWKVRTILTKRIF